MYIFTHVCVHVHSSAFDIFIKSSLVKILKDPVQF